MGAFMQGLLASGVLFIFGLQTIQVLFLFFVTYSMVSSSQFKPMPILDNLGRAFKLLRSHPQVTMDLTSQPVCYGEYMKSYTNQQNDLLD